MNNTIAQMVTDRIIEQMEKGIIPWQKPWVGTGGAISHVTGKPYSVINQMLLGEAGEYLTFNQIQAEGGKLKKGAQARIVIFWKVFVKEEERNGEKKTVSIPTLRYYRVFHINDCENIPEKYGSAKRYINAPDEEAERIVTEYQVRESIRINREKEEDKAYYSPLLDEICVPMINQFSTVSEFYSTLFHEMTHSTGHMKRLGRLNMSTIAAFGSNEYSKEELVAELGAAMLINTCGLDTDFTVKNSAAYLQSWLRALKNDATLIISAASKAEKAVDYILSV